MHFYVTSSEDSFGAGMGLVVNVLSVVPSSVHFTKNYLFSSMHERDCYWGFSVCMLHVNAHFFFVFLLSPLVYLSCTDINVLENGMLLLFL